MSLEVVETEGDTGNTSRSFSETLTPTLRSEGRDFAAKDKKNCCGRDRRHGGDGHDVFTQSFRVTTMSREKAIKPLSMSRTIRSKSSNVCVDICLSGEKGLPPTGEKTRGAKSGGTLCVQTPTFQSQSTLHVPRSCLSSATSTPEKVGVMNSVSISSFGGKTPFFSLRMRTRSLESISSGVFKSGTVARHGEEKIGRTRQAESAVLFATSEKNKSVSAWAQESSSVSEETGGGDSRVAQPACRSGQLPLPVFVQDYSAVCAELERKKQGLQWQLKQLQKKLCSQNIFSLVWANNALELQHLLEQGGQDVNKRDYNGCTPLHLAALKGNGIIVRVLVAFGADVMAMDNTGRTPLDLAAANRDSGVFHYFMNLTQRREQQQQKHQGCNVKEPTLLRGKRSTLQNNRPQNMSKDPNAQSSVRLASFPQITQMSPSSFFSTSEFEGEAEPQGNLVPSLALTRVVEEDTATSIPPDHGATYSSVDENVLLDEEDIETDHISQKHSSYLTISDTVSLVVCMVGLPGRGKSYIACRVSRYLNWKGVPCRVFNAGNYRRQLIGLENTVDPGFYDPNNADGRKIRDILADIACEALMKFISQHRIAVGIFDATNTTKARRTHLVEFFSRMAKQFNVKYSIIFIESVCTDNNLITENILRSKCGNDDFKHVTDSSEVIASFRSRIAQYEKVYEPLGQNESLSFIRIINVKSHVVLHKIPCGLASRIAFFLLNLHPVAYPIYIALSGETEGERKHVYGGSERLTPLGEKFAMEVKRFVLQRFVPNMLVIHGTNPSVLNTLKPLAQALRGETGDEGCRREEEENSYFYGAASQKEFLCPQPGLDSINYGYFSGRTVDWAQRKYASLSRLLYVASPTGSVDSELNTVGAKMPRLDPTSESDAPQEPGGQNDLPLTQHFDKSAQAIRRFRHIPDGTDLRLSYRVQFPHGESCRQVNVRLEPALMTIMRVRGPVFVFATAVPAQGVLAFFADVIPEMSPTLRLPRNAVVEIGVKGDITVHQLVDA